ncbi:MAG: hypothetical protein AAF244_04085 [Pseudomonadota bacterium]
MNIDDYFTFEDPNEPLPNVFGGEPTQTQPLAPQDISTIQKALEEIASTTDGSKLIKQAAANDPDGKINITGNPDGITAAFKTGEESNIAISGKDAGMQYKSPETGEWHDFSVQRMIVEELFHQALSHDGITPENEAEAKRLTDAYMKEHYGEPPQGTATPEFGKNIRFSGTDKWDYNTNFRGQSASLNLNLPAGPEEDVIQQAVLRPGDHAFNPDNIETADLKPGEGRGEGGFDSSVHTAHETLEHILPAGEFDIIVAKHAGVIADVAGAGIKIDPAVLRKATLEEAAPDLSHDVQDFGL